MRRYLPPDISTPENYRLPPDIFHTQTGTCSASADALSAMGRSWATAEHEPNLRISASSVEVTVYEQLYSSPSDRKQEAQLSPRDRAMRRVS